MSSKVLSLTGSLALLLWMPGQVWAFCNTEIDEETQEPVSGAVSAYTWSGQGNFSCKSLNMLDAAVTVTKPTVFGGNGIDWLLADNEVDVVAVSDSNGKRCVYNYGPGAAGGQNLTPNSAQLATQVIACKDDIVQDAPNTAPEISITIKTADDGGVYPGGQPITLSATYVDKEDPSTFTPEITWTSSLEGELGRTEPSNFCGSTIDCGDISPILRSGLHTITAQAQDSGGLLGSSQVQVTVEAVVVPLCQSNGENVLINGVEVSCPTDGSQRVVCSADISDTANLFELADQAKPGCCVCGVTAVECDPSLPASDDNACPNPFVADTGDIDEDKVLRMQVPTSIMFNNDPYYCITSGGKQTCYRY